MLRLSLITVGQVHADMAKRQTLCHVQDLHFALRPRIDAILDHLRIGVNKALPVSSKLEIKHRQDRRGLVSKVELIEQE